MSDHVRARPTRLAVLFATLLLAGWALFGAPLTARAAGGAITYTKESYGQYQGQLAAGQVKEVTINERLRSLRITLDSGQHVLARYAPKQEPAVAEALQAKGVVVTVLKPAAGTAGTSSKPVHHKLRYIAGGILVVVIIIVAIVLVVNRRRKALAD